MKLDNWNINGYLTEKDIICIYESLQIKFRNHIKNNYERDKLNSLINKIYNICLDNNIDMKPYEFYNNK